MDMFIFFNQRLTEKLNLIYKYPFTVVSGHSGVGKTFAVRNYLITTKAKSIWHIMKEKSFSLFLKEFADNLSIWGIEMEDDILCENETMTPADMAVKLGIALKKHMTGERLVYVIEYMSKDAPDEIMEFLSYLSGQYITGVYVILSFRNCDVYHSKKFLDTHVNFISEQDFLLNPTEIRYAFQKHDISLGTEEAEFIYLCSKGWFPIIRELYEEIKQNGKKNTYERSEIITEKIFSAAGEAQYNIEKQLHDGHDIYGGNDFDFLCQLIESYDLVNARIALERLKIKAEPHSPEDDICLYYHSLIRILNGEAKKVSEELIKQFELCIREQNSQRASRIFYIGLNLRIFLGSMLFAEEKELIDKFINLRLTKNIGISLRSACMSLFLEKNYYKLLAVLEMSEGWKERDECWKEFLYAVSYKMTENRTEMKKHLKNALALAEKDGTMLPLLWLYDAFQENDITEVAENTNRIIDSPNFKRLFQLYHRAKKNNNGGNFVNQQDELTLREKQIVEYISKGLTNKEIAAQLNISENTVKATLKKIFIKIGITSRKELML